MLLFKNPSLTQLKKRYNDKYEKYVSTTISDLSYLYFIQQQFPKTQFEFYIIWLCDKCVPKQLILHSLNLFKLFPSERREFKVENITRFTYIINSTTICLLYFFKDDYFDFYLRNTSF